MSADVMEHGQLVRVIGGPWPERIGLMGLVVTGPNVYPWHGRAPSEVVIYIPDDPLNGGGIDAQRVWSCAISRTALQTVDPDDEAEAHTQHPGTSQP